MRKTKTQKLPSELRFDPVAKSWVVIATGRARRPENFRQEDQKEERARWTEAKKVCPFEDMSDQERPTYALYKGKEVELSLSAEGHNRVEWTTISIPNKFPAFAPGTSLRKRSVGPYSVIDGVGFHEVIITKEHNKDIPQFSLKRTKELMDVYHARFSALKDKKYVNYISIFKNKGPRAGASVAHPHSQLIALPIMNPDIERSLAGSSAFQKQHNRCVHCKMLDWDRKEKKRIVYENDCYTVVCPFASRAAFEIRIYPRIHLSYFEKIDSHQRECLADAFLVTLKKLYKALNDPDYNYFLHTAPVDGKKYDHYHWHWEIFPKTATWAGFEIGTGIEISTIEPEKAAQFLRKQ